MIVKDTWVLIWVCFAVSFGLFSFAYIAQLITRIGAIADIVWGLVFPSIVTVLVLLIGEWRVRNYLVLVLVAVWGLRLSIHLWIRVMHEGEDKRYKSLRSLWGKKQNKFMLGFYCFQALLASLLALGFLPILFNASADLLVLEIAGAIVWLIGFIGEAAADYQLTAFKRSPGNKDDLCNTGLWYFSRHPNYFFEWLIWLSYFLIAVASPWGLLTIYCPLVMLFLLTQVTGIPATEKLMIETRGDKFLEYVRTTSAFIPLPKRK